MPDEDVKQVYWRQMRRLTFAMAALAAAVALVLPWFVAPFDAYRFLRFPLGYFLMAQGGVILLALLVYAFFNRQERIDRTHNMTIQF